MDTMDEEFDIVVDTLQKKVDELWKITNSNMSCEFLGMGIMDDIRLDQIKQLEDAIELRKKSLHP